MALDRNGGAGEMNLGLVGAGEGGSMQKPGALKENRTMNGIQYVTDEKGRKLAVQIDLKKHRELWEDIEDVLVSRSRRNEKRIPLATVKAALVKSGKLAP